MIKKFLGSFRLLVNAGIPITEALEISRYEIKNLYFRNFLNFAKNELLKGKSFHESISQLYTESSQLKNMIKIGEETGELLYILEKLNDIYNLKVDRAFKEIKDKSFLVLYAAVLFLLATLIFKI